MYKRFTRAARLHCTFGGTPRLAEAARARCGARKYDSGSRWQSGGDVVLVGESADDLLPADPAFGEVDRFMRVGVSLSWGELAEGAVRRASL